MAVVLALTLGALAWIVDQGAGYPLVKVVCRSGDTSVLTMVSAGAFALAALGGWYGVRAARIEHRRFLALVAVGFNALVLIFVAMTLVFPFLLSPCE